MTSLREQLAKKRSRTTSVTFPAGDAGEKAAREYEEAQQAVRLLELYQSQGKDIDDTRAKATLRKAKAAYEKNSLTLTFRGLSPDEVDALRGEFTVQEDDSEGDFDLRGYTAALVAACVLDSDLTVDEWAAELYESGRWSDGEVRKIRETATAAYSEAPSPTIPKD